MNAMISFATLITTAPYIGALSYLQLLGFNTIVVSWRYCEHWDMNAMISFATLITTAPKIWTLSDIKLYKALIWL